MHIRHLWLYSVRHMVKDHTARDETHCQHSTHFYLWLYSVRHMVKNHTAREESCTATWETLSDLQQGCFYINHPTDRIAHTTTFITPVVEHWLEQEIANVMRDRSMSRCSTTELRLIALIKTLQRLKMKYKMKPEGDAHASINSWCDGSSDRSLMVDPLSYFSFQSVLHY